MAESGCFYSIEGSREKTIKIKRSVFICSLEKVSTVQEAKVFISRISKENKNATHNCWAYIVGDKAEISHSSDAGEPSGTAGKPMLNTLQSHDMTNIVAVVTRYSGGVKLGVRGLIQAYSASVEAAVNMASPVRLIHKTAYTIEVSYEFNNTLLARLEPYIFKIVDTEYSQIIIHEVEIEVKNKARVEQMLSDYQGQGLIKKRLL